ncbi:MAG: hypothetical protein LHW46_01545 [Candidatus Cloacimonetes bacterium]|jgi:hypothetical protein|nr:hypothetical protein [Candidatus Cloacimonadota bacterium]MCK9334496.1 hypothetical protein [Candidatus Cloacimonadota bacterium]MDD4033794.1 hypothetical protein [Candidatus Cloacimonadota bacterium]MDY0336274.1 hypothetical protein [Candidatus Cloacimonadaceae bacterium]
MRCKKCNAKLAEHDIWCMACGSPSPVLKNELASMPVLRSTWNAISSHWSEYVPVVGIAIILGIIPMAIITYVLSFVITLDNGSDMSYIMNMIIKSALYSIFIPMILIPFSLLSKPGEYSLKLQSLGNLFRHYGKYFLFGLINTLYFVIIHLICFGLPSFASDPILRLVWIVLVNYWVAICLPVPILMEEKQLNPWKAIKLSYRHLHDLRWNIYLLALVLTLINAIAFSLALFPLLFSLPFSYFAIRDYCRKLIDFELLEYRIS